MVPMNFVDYEARRDVLCLVSNVDHPAYSGRGYAQDEILDNFVLPVSFRTSFPRPDFHGLRL